MVSRTNLKSTDPEIYGALRQETERQESSLEMIPSENFVSEAVLEAIGSTATNKYAEGLPGKRYYGGCHCVDEMEEIAISRAKKLFGCEFVNVQPHSGAQANQAVYEAVCQKGDTVMGMRLDMGGHLTHGSPVNFSGKNYKIVAYGVTKDTHLIDPDEVRKLALEHKPKLIICGASAYSRKIDFDMFRKVADEVGAILMADIAHYAGLIAGGVYPSPINSCDIVTTTTHKTLRGPRSGMIMAKEKYGKALNKAVFPGLQGGPHMHTIAAKAVSFREALQPEFKKYAQAVVDNARALSDELKKIGLSIISGGTDSHVMLVDLRPAEVSGKEAEGWLDSVGITVNKNGIPYDPQPPMVTSGIRLGTPALTTRGMNTSDMKKIAGWIKETLAARGNEEKLALIRDGIKETCKKYPLYLHRLV
ncbi:MAG: serine hydroxymethyltransferase [bacterium]|nr:serine hydroxymethyltransferase [bacterium]